MKKFIILLILAIVLGSGLYFVYDQFTPKQIAEPIKEIPKEINFTVTGFEHPTELPGNVDADSGNEFLVVKLSGVNNDVVNRFYNVFYFRVVDEDGKKYENSINTTTDALTYGELAPGETVRGSIVFEVPKGSKGKIFLSDEDGKDLQTFLIK